MGLLDFLREKPKSFGPYNGGTGSTMEDSVIITSSSSSMGVPAEYDYIRMQCGPSGWAIENQALLDPDGPDGKHYHWFTVKMKDGTLREFYFDISSFFGRP